MKNFDMVKSIKRLGDRMKISATTSGGAVGNPGGLVFPIVAADNCWYWTGNDSPGFGHAARNGDATEKKPWTNMGSAGWLYGSSGEGLINFVKDDVCVKSFPVTRYSYLDSRFVTAYSTNFLLPEEFGVSE